MSGNKPTNLLGGARQKPKRPRIPLKTPTPLGGSTGFGLSATPPQPFSPPTPAMQALPKLEMDLEKLSIHDKKYRFTADELIPLGHIGDGAFGTVTKMLFPQTETEMAVKKIPVRELRATDKDEILELAVVMQGGTCPYIVNFYGCLIRDGDVWICMELLDSSMDKIIDRVYNQLKTSIPENIIGKMSTSMIRALHYLKKEMRIIHRDVKPSNILVSATGCFKLCDFGISGRLVDSIAVTMEVGCRPYMAPERIDPMRAEQGYTVLSDVWSFGITLVEIVLGSFPYNKWTTIFEQLNAVVNGPPPKLPNDGHFSQELQLFSAACLIKDSSKRPNYEQLQEYAFFSKYDKAEVDVATWYQSIKR